MQIQIKAVPLHSQNIAESSYSPKGVRAAEASPDGTIAVRVQINGESTFLNVTPKRTPALPWGEPEFVDVRKAIKAENRPTFDE